MYIQIRISHENFFMHNLYFFVVLFFKHIGVHIMFQAWVRFFFFADLNMIILQQTFQKLYQF